MFDTASVTRRRLVPVLAVAAAALGVPAVADAQLRLKKCDEGRCGTLSVPLDATGAVGGRLSLRVMLAPPRRGPRAGATLLLAGGPGQGGVSAFVGGSFADEWADMWQGATPRNAIVAFDQRGTGAGALRCRDLEAAAASDAGREAAACAAMLGRRRGFFRTTDTVGDIEALRVALGVERLTIAGFSYGTYVAQRYALAHPERVERLLLDSVVEASGVDPLYRDVAAAARRLLPAFCTFGCASFTRDPLGDTARLIERLRAGPLRGTVVSPRGEGRPVRLNRQELLYTLMTGDVDPFSRADYPAAVVSALRGDTAPLMRLKRRAIASEGGGAPGSFSSATYAATLCEELRFPWSWHASPAERDEATAMAEAGMDPALAFPFDPGTLVRNDSMRLCRRWPAASPGPPPEPGTMPDVPVLAMSGTEDLRTPFEGAQRAAARFPRGQALAIPGVGHSVIGWSGCANRAMARFLRGRPVQGRCPSRRPVIRPARPVPASLGAVRRARAVTGRRGRVVTAVAMTVGDLIDDLYSTLFLSLDDRLSDEYAIRGGGLRGGSWSISDRAAIIDRLEFVPGVRISARDFYADDGVEDDPLRLRVSAPGGLDGRIALAGGDDTVFRVRGRLGGRRIRTRVRIRIRAFEAFGVGGASASATDVLEALPCAPRGAPLAPLRRLPIPPC